MRFAPPKSQAAAILAAFLLATPACGQRIDSTSPPSDDPDSPSNTTAGDATDDDRASADQNTGDDRTDAGTDMADAGAPGTARDGGIPTCGDGLDNDGDGNTDLEDPDCDAIPGSEGGADTPRSSSADAESDGDATDVPSIPIYRVNAGGPELSGASAWEADGADRRSPYLTGAGQQFGEARDDEPAVTAADDVPETVPRRLFETERWDAPGSEAGGAGEMAYQFDVDAGSYRVRLYFCETWPGALEPGVRRFDVTINGRTVLSDYDIYDEAGGFTGTVEPFDVETIDDGEEITVTFHHLPDGNNPMVAGLEVLSPPSRSSETSAR